MNKHHVCYIDARAPKLVEYSPQRTCNVGHHTQRKYPLAKTPKSRKSVKAKLCNVRSQAQREYPLARPSKLAKTMKNHWFCSIRAPGPKGVPFGQGAPYREILLQKKQKKNRKIQFSGFLENQKSEKQKNRVFLFF